MARHGENIRKRKDGRWEGRYKIFDEKKGRYRYRSVYDRDYGAVKEKLCRARLGITAFASQKADEPGLTRGSTEADSTEERTEVCSGVLFSQAAGEWLEEIAVRRKYSTYIKYDMIYRTHLAGTAGSCRISADAGQELQEKIFDHISQGELSESLQKSIVCVANQILAFADRNYASGCPRLEQLSAKTKKKTAGAFSRGEQTRLLGGIYDGMDKFMIAVLLCLYAGLRLGEVCALQWTDIDLDGMTLTVNRTVQRIAVSGYQTRTILLETEPKSESSRRTIPLTDGILELLLPLREGQTYVFGGEKPLEPRTMQYRYKKLLKEAGIDDRNFHTLRHTFATNCVENGMDVKVLSEILGHSDVKITLNRYVHPTMDSKRKQMGGLSEFYGQICGQAA